MLLYLLNNLIKLFLKNLQAIDTVVTFILLLYILQLLPNVSASLIFIAFCYIQYLFIFASQICQSLSLYLSSPFVFRKHLLFQRSDEYQLMFMFYDFIFIYSWIKYDWIVFFQNLTLVYQQCMESFFHQKLKLLCIWIL